MLTNIFNAFISTTLWIFNIIGEYFFGVIFIIKKLIEIIFIDWNHPAILLFTFQWKQLAEYELWMVLFSFGYSFMFGLIIVEFLKFIWVITCAFACVIIPIFWLEFFIVSVFTLVPISSFIGLFWKHKNFGMVINNLSVRFVKWLIHVPFGYWQYYRSAIFYFLPSNSSNNATTNAAIIAALAAKKK